MVFIMVFLVFLFSIIPNTTCLPLPVDIDSILGKFQSYLGSDSSLEGSRKQVGKFLHITDLHPDPDYQVGSNAPRELCHRGDGEAGPFGAKLSKCDVPYTLIDQTFSWMTENLRHELDFVVWTGDNVPHDRDDKLPRSADVLEMENRHIADMMKQAFYEHDDPKDPKSIPVVPTLGNNDVYPHNIFTKGPNSQTRLFLDIWRDFIPEDQAEIFLKGGYFAREVIPHKLAVISLNTQYFFNRNTEIHGCAAKSEPGAEMLEWLSDLLEHYRQKGIKVWIIGHAPPNSRNYVQSCLSKFTLTMHEYRDVIVGSLFGHMNIDHFISLDSADIKDEQEQADIFYNGEDIIPNDGDDYMKEISQEYRHMEITKKDPLGERYSLAFVSPSVATNYLPTLRVWEYNATSLNVDKTYEKIRHTEQQEIVLSKKATAFSPGPAYYPQLFTPLRYVQYFCNLTQFDSLDSVSDVDNHWKSKFFEVEYATDHLPYKLRDLTVKSMIKLARKLGDPKDSSCKEEVAAKKGHSCSPNVLWNEFLHRAFVSTGAEES